jgi:hypothetical protein
MPIVGRFGSKNSPIDNLAGVQRSAPFWVDFGPNSVESFLTDRYGDVSPLLALYDDPEGQIAAYGRYVVAPCPEEKWPEDENPWEHGSLLAMEHRRVERIAALHNLVGKAQKERLSEIDATYGLPRPGTTLSER